MEPVSSCRDVEEVADVLPHPFAAQEHVLPLALCAGMAQSLSERSSKMAQRLAATEQLQQLHAACDDCA